MRPEEPRIMYIIGTTYALVFISNKGIKTRLLSASQITRILPSSVQRELTFIELTTLPQVLLFYFNREFHRPVAIMVYILFNVEEDTKTASCIFYTFTADNREDPVQHVK